MKKVGTKIFSLINKICQDRERTFLPTKKIRKLIEILLNNPIEVREECFMLLIKQVTDNPYIDKNFNEWKLMAIVSSFVSPSETFLYYFINKIESIFKETLNDEVKQWSRYVVKRILQTNIKSERFVLPCEKELNCIEERRKIPIEIFFPNGSSEFFFVESYTTVKELKEEIIKKYEFSEFHQSYYGLYEYSTKSKSTEETFIDDKIKIMDVLGSWVNEINFLKLKHSLETVNVKFKLIFMIRFEFKSDLISDKILTF